MKKLFSILFGLVLAFDAGAQISNIDTTTVRVAATTNKYLITITNLANAPTNATIINTNAVTTGDTLPMLLAKEKNNWTWFLNWMGTNSPYNGYTNFWMNGVVGGLSGANDFTAQGATEIIAIVNGWAQTNANLGTNTGGGGNATNAIPIYNGGGYQTSITNNLTLVNTNASGYWLQRVCLNGTGYTPADDCYVWCPSCGVMTNSSGGFLLHINNTNACGDWTGYDLDASNFLVRAGFDCSLTVEAMALNTMVVQLKYAGLWTNFYALYPFIGHTTNSDSLNLFGTNYTIQWSGFMATTAAHGVWGVTNTYSSLTNNYGDSGFIPASFLPGISNNFSISEWTGSSYTNTVDYTGSENIGTGVGIAVRHGPINYSVMTNTEGVYMLGYTGGTQNRLGSGVVVASTVSGTKINQIVGTNSLVSSTTAYGLDVPVHSMAVDSIWFGDHYLSASLSYGFLAYGTQLTTNQMTTLANIINNFCSFRPLVLSTPTPNGSYTQPNQTNTASIWSTSPTNNFAGQYFAVFFPCGTNSYYMKVAVAVPPATVQPKFANAIVTCGQNSALYAVPGVAPFTAPTNGDAICAQH